MKFIAFLILVLLPTQAFAGGVAKDVLFRSRSGHYAVVTNNQLSVSSSNTDTTTPVPGLARDVRLRDQEGHYAIINSDGSLQAG